MHKITFGGKEYVKATEIAKKFRYTQDYVGQLCRSGKVEARLVGRSWYVVVDSVVAYRKTKHQTQKKSAKKYSSKTKKSDRNPKRPAKRVEPVVRAKTVKLTSVSTAKPATKLTPEYDTDSNVLIPVLDARKKATSQKSKKPAVTIEARPSVTVNVTSEKKKGTKFKSEKLPEISLSGKLSVTDNSDENVETDLVEVNSSKELNSDSGQTAREQVTSPRKNNEVPDVLEQTDVVVTKKANTSAATAQKRVEFTPKLLVDKQSGRRNFILVSSGCILVAAFVSMLVLGVGHEIVVFDNESESYYQFRAKNVKEIF